MSRPTNPTAGAAEDVVTGSLASRFLVTLGRPFRTFAVGEEAPLGLHWCLAPEIPAADDVGPDGIARSGIIPTLDLPRRMWAGGTVQFHAPLRIGEEVSRRSEVLDVSRKDGRSGPLAFVRIGHRFTVGGEARIDEEQTIVYLSARPASDVAVPAGEAAHQAGRVLRTVRTDPPMLFRFSALTFNAHRIHYDRPYAREVEELQDVLVHGTLTAALLLDAWTELVGVPPPACVAFRALKPVRCGVELRIAGSPTTGGVRLHASDDIGTCMVAEDRGP